MEALIKKSRAGSYRPNVMMLRIHSEHLSWELRNAEAEQRGKFLSRVLVPNESNQMTVDF